MNELDFGSDSESNSPPPSQIKKNKSCHSAPIPFIFPNRSIRYSLFVDAQNYDFLDWPKAFPNKLVHLRSLVRNPEWDEFFSSIENKPYFKKIQSDLSDHLSKSKSKMIVPRAELIFNAFNITSPSDIKVIIIGQDPYPGFNQATGLAFSAPLNSPIPKSLINIFSNLLDYGHLSHPPIHPCLSPWSLQGVFLLNTALTTLLRVRDAHSKLWEYFKLDLILYLNSKLSDIVYVAWGSPAHQLCLNIDPKKNSILTSSHPSPMSYDRGLNGRTYGILKNASDRKQAYYPAFKTVDHFGKINQYLIMKNKSPILWDLILDNIHDIIN